ncbi:MAG: GNAT family N-acetyltransferase [Bacteroides cellulosilyticus]
MTVNSSTYAVPFYKSLGFEQVKEPQITNGLKYVPMKREIK